MNAKIICLLFILNAFYSNAQQAITLTTGRTNISGIRAAIDDPALNNNPDAIVLVEQNAAHPHPIGVWYIFNQWHVFNLDQANMPSGLQFHIQFWTKPDASHFAHIVSKENLQGNRSYIDNPVLNNSPNASWTAFQSMSNTRGGYWNANQITAQYDATAKKWYLVNENGSNLSSQNAYNIAITATPDMNVLPANQIATGSVLNIPASSSPAETPEPLRFKPILGKKIILYPGTTGDVGLGVQGNLLQIYSDNPNADVAIGYDQAGTFNEKFRVKASGALAVNGNAGQPGQVLVSNGPGTAPNWQSGIGGIQTSFKTGGSSTKYLGDSEKEIIPGVSHTITVTKKSRLIISLTVSMLRQTCVVCNAAQGRIWIKLNTVDLTNSQCSISTDGLESHTISNFMVDVNPGVHQVDFWAGYFLGATFQVYGKFSSIIVVSTE